MIVEIKEYSPEIHQFVCRLIRQLTPNRKDLSEPAFRAILDSDNVCLFVIHDDNETPVGMLTTGVYRTPTGYKAWIEDVVVDDKHRGLGYGKIIVEHAIAYLRGLGVDTISLTTNSARIAANQLYRSLGFELYETNVYRIRL